MRLHFLYMNLIQATRRLPILRPVMRKPLLLLALLALAVPAAALAAPEAGDGSLSVADGRGRVSVQARGGIIGRIERGSVLVYDLSPEDTSVPAVSGDDVPVRFVGDGVQYGGKGVRFRLVGGAYKIVVNGSGIDLSAVGNGFVVLEGKGSDPGTYSFDGDDCSAPDADCKPLPSKPTRFKLGSGPDRADKNNRQSP